ncbi:hypothetical protein FDP51_14700 [Enterococcus mundtii]|uniref:helix-turn-helix domain-containing protein n=1 Tax=Enterococcus mundtii TaxID=53346 RepID=UPI00129CAFA0|nr:helix-turn-helix domain-containing protein [Enterococcus mundtii]MRI75195.1 hypothetical protein [Enterococcus mundtii]
MNKFQFQFIFNKQTIRFYKIISAFQHNKIISLKDLSKLTNSSLRTVSSDIVHLKNHFGNSIEIFSSKNGYSLKIRKKKKFGEYRKQLIKKEPIFEIIESIFFSETLTLQDWAEKLFLDEVTLKRYLVKIAPILEEYNIVITSGAGKIDFIGPEISIRKFFHDFYYNSAITSQTIFPSIAVQEINHNLKKDHEFKEYSYNSFHSFNYTLFIALERIKKGNTLVNLVDNKLKVCMLKSNSVLAVLEQVQKQYNITLSDEDKIYLYINFVTDRSIYGSINSNKNFLDKFDIFSGVSKELAEKYLTETAFPLAKKTNIILLYQTFFTTILLKNALSSILNLNNQEVISYAKQEYPILYQKVYLFLKKNLQNRIVLNSRLLDSISSSLVFFTDSVVAYYWKPGKNIACIIEGPPTLVDNIRLDIFKLFERNHNLYFPDALEINQNYFEENHIDIILTNYDEISFDIHENIEIYLTETIPSKINWREVQEIINPKIPDFFPLD